MNNCKHLLLLVVAAAAVPGAASAQEAVVGRAVSHDTYDPANLLDFVGRGRTFDNGANLRLVFGLEGGADSNVYFQDTGEGIQGAGILRPTGVIRISNEKLRASDYADEEGEVPELTPRTFDYDAGLRLSYNTYLSGEETVRGQHGLRMVGFADMLANTSDKFAFVLRERYIRDSRSPNFEDNDPVNRSENRLWVGARLSPTPRVSETLYYENFLSAFENTSAYPSRMNHTFGLRHTHMIGDRAHFIADASYGVFGPYGDGASSLAGPKNESNPFRALAGFAYAATPNISLKAHGGYAFSNYDMGPYYSSPIGGAEVGFHWKETGRFLAQYLFDYYDSLNADYYRDHMFGLKLVQQAGFALLDGGPEIRLRKYFGIPRALGPAERGDTIVALRARVQAILAERFALSGEYRLASTSTDYSSDADMKPGFARHEFTVGVWAAY